MRCRLPSCRFLRILAHVDGSRPAWVIERNTSRSVLTVGSKGPRKALVLIEFGANVRFQQLGTNPLTDRQMNDTTIYRQLGRCLSVCVGSCFSPQICLSLV